jgi:hypothetical protein
LIPQVWFPINISQVEGLRNNPDYAATQINEFPDGTQCNANTLKIEA